MGHGWGALSGGRTMGCVVDRIAMRACVAVKGCQKRETWQPVGEALAVSDLASPQARRRRRRRRREAVHSSSSVNGDGGVTAGLWR